MASRILTGLIGTALAATLTACSGAGPSSAQSSSSISPGSSAADPVATASQSDSASESESGPQVSTVARLSVEILETHPFNEASFTQGLEVEPDGTLLVGTGQWGESEIYRAEVGGSPTQPTPLPEDHFGEGVTRHGDTVWQLTWQAGVAYQRDAETLEEVSQVSYPGEGWGLCSFPDELIMSDGTSELRYLDPATFAERGRTHVTLDGTPVQGINELECVDGPEGREVYANIFTETDILRIDPATGEVTAVIDASGVPNNAAPDPNNVLNGIAHLTGTDRFYLTGKRWPDLYEVRFVPEA